MTNERHNPVMLNEVISALNPRDGAIYVDGTFGGGGYSRALLEAAQCRVWGIDRDPDACARGAVMAAEFDGRLTMLTGCFGDMTTLLAGEKLDAVDGVALDLGVSSFQIDQANRGFSFKEDGPLDMRMSQDGPSAADIVNNEAETELANIIYQFGDERRSRRIAKAIVKARNETPITRTSQLALIVRQCFPPPSSAPNSKTIDPATRTFQALRIYVNDELGELSRGLHAAETVLRDGACLAVVSFHSLEDRLVKAFLRERSGGTPRTSRHLPQINSDNPTPSFSLAMRRAARPSKGEVAVNSRSRSAKFRSATRTSSDAWPWTGSHSGIHPNGGTA